MLLNSALSAVVPRARAGELRAARARARASRRPARRRADALRGLLVRDDELRLGSAVEGVRLHWRRGSQLGALGGVVVPAGLMAVPAYGRRGSLAAGVRRAYVLSPSVFQLCLWPLAAPSGLAAARACCAARGGALRRPRASVGLALALLAVNALGAAAAVLPLLTMTVAYSFVAAAHFALPPNSGRPALMARVTFDHVSKSFDGTVAVDDLALEIDDGEFLVLVGPSGCGKTTALRMLAGLEEVTGGRILIGDRVVNNLAPGDRDIAMVFQSYALYPHMTVYDNLAFGLRNRKVAEGRDRPARDERRRDPRSERADQPQAEAALRRPAPARRARPRDRARAGRVPDGRAALQPRRGAARADARRDPQAPAPPRDDDDLRHARPGRGDDDGRPDRRHEARRPPAGRHARGALHPARQRLRRRLHRLARR